VVLVDHQAGAWAGGEGFELLVDFGIEELQQLGEGELLHWDLIRTRTTHMDPHQRLSPGRSRVVQYLQMRAPQRESM